VSEIRREESGLRLLDVQVGALECGAFIGSKDQLVGTLLAVWAFGITGEMAVNLIGCLITGAGVLSN
jgi:hypothetical protein